MRKILVPLLFLLPGCSVLEPPQHVSLSSNNGGANGQLLLPHVILTGPADLTATRETLEINGSCTNGLSVNISGDITSIVDTQCLDSSFSAQVTLSSGEGLKTVRVSQSSASYPASVVTRVFTRDNTAPLLTLSTPTANAWARTQVVIQGSCETGVPVSFLENGSTSQIACASGAFATTLPLRSGDGSVLIAISQTDAAGNRSNIDLTVRKDTIAPSITITAPAANASVNGQVSVTGTCEAGLDVLIEGAGVAAPVSGLCASGTFSLATVFTTGAGAKAIRVSQTDFAGNRTAIDRNVNRVADVAPAIAFSAPAANTVFQNSLTVSGTCTTGLTVNFSGAGWSAPATTTCASGTFSAAIAFTSGDGTKNIIASQTNAQNLTGSASRSFVRDLTAPGLNVSSPAANSLARTSVTLMGACENGIVIQISGTGAAAASTASCANGAYSASVNFSAGDGAKLIQLSQRDAAGNLASISRTFQRDSTAPALTIASPAADSSHNTGLTITGACEGTFAVVASGSGVSGSVSRACASGAYSLDVTFSSGDGAKLVQVAQTDAAGNTATLMRNFVRMTPAPVIDGPALYAQNCAACHGALNVSTKQNRTLTQISGAIMNVGQMQNLAGLSTAQREAIAQALYVAPTAPAFACDPNQPLEQRAIAKNVKRLTRRQYVNTLNDLMARAFSVSAAQGHVSAALNGIALPTDDDSSFSRFDSSLVRQHMKAYFDVSDALAARVTSSANYSAFVSGFINLDRGTCTTINASALSTDCATRFIANFGRRALRRPLINNAEVNEPSIYMSAYTEAGGNAAGVNAVVFKLLLAPQFLFQIENDGVLVSGQLYTVSSHAVASRLSYMFWNSMPDESLFQQAAAANLSGNTAFVNALNYVVDHAKAQDSVREFMSEWLKLRHTPQFQTNNASLNFLADGLTLDASLRSAMIGEIEELGAYVYNHNLPFTDLFTTDVSFARDSRLMSIYGVSTAAPAVVTPSNAIRLPAGQRSGLLTRGAMLVGGSELANPIKRGIRVRKEILCLPLDNPPVELEDALEPPTPNENLTTRQRYDNATSPAACMSCHQHINSLGHSFSNFNSFGKFNTSEPTFNAQGSFSGRFLPIDSQVDLSISLGSGLMASGGNQASELIANHRNTRLCVSEKALKFAEGREADRTKEGCRLNGLYERLVQSQSLKEFLKSVAQDPEFRHRLIVN